MSKLGDSFANFCSYFHIIAWFVTCENLWEIALHVCCCCCSVRPNGWQPTRLPRPWDSPGKNTGVGCHYLLQCMKVKSESEVAQLHPTLSDPMDCSLPGSSVHGIFQARGLEWGAIAHSNFSGLFLRFSVSFTGPGIFSISLSFYSFIVHSVPYLSSLSSFCFGLNYTSPGV